MKSLFPFLAALALLLTTHFVIISTVSDQFHAFDSVKTYTSPLKHHEGIDSSSFNGAAFKRIDLTRNLGAGTTFSIFTTSQVGLLVADLNNDGLQDIYLPNNTYSGEMAQKIGNQLLINTKDGLILSGPEKLSPKELIGLDLLYPFKKSKEGGRISQVAIAADLNGDGRLDLIIGNGLPGSIWSSKETQRTLPVFGHPLGRKSRKSPYKLSAPLYQTKYNKVYDDRYTKIHSQRGLQLIGQNSIYLNLGDQDKNGYPEWKDVTMTSKFGGSRNTVNLSVADVDLDGDLDIFVGNIPDPDFWPGGATGWAGARNELYINQIVETGVLTFQEKSYEMGVDDSFEIKDLTNCPRLTRIKTYPLLPTAYSLRLSKMETYCPEILKIKDQKSESANITWSSVFQDVNGDGFPDLWVANDFNQLHLFLNDKGRGFIKKYHNSFERGNWMGFALADFDKDGTEDIFAANSGGAMFNQVAYDSNLYRSLLNPTIMEATALELSLSKKLNKKHIIIDGSNPLKSLKVCISPSSLLPPDIISFKNKNPLGKYSFFTPKNISSCSLDLYEFSWGSVSLDIQNDGLPDLYFIGNLYMRGQGIFGQTASNPGRLLINTGLKNDTLHFIDRSVEYEVLNINELNYHEKKVNSINRKSPSLNWSRGDTIFNNDKTASIYTYKGIKSKPLQYSNLIQMSENGRSLAVGDFNNDGFEDILLRNFGGHDSQSSQAKQLSIINDGKKRYLPPHHYSFPIPTEFEKGKLLLFLNKNSKNHWVKISLKDRSLNQFNYFAIGAKIIVNQKHIRTVHAGTGSSSSNQFGPIIFGLGIEKLKEIKIIWPDIQRSKTSFSFPKEIKNKHLLITKKEKVVKYEYVP
jgi:hypothetical protein